MDNGVSAAVTAMEQAVRRLDAALGKRAAAFRSLADQHGAAAAELRALREELQAARDEAAALRERADQIGRHTSELQSLMRISYAVFCLKKKQQHIQLQPPRRRNTLD